MATIGKYKLLKLLGTGSFAKVFLGEHMDTGKRYAIKIIQVSKGKNQYDVSELAQKEIEITCTMNHNNIIKVFDSSISELLTSPSGKQKEVCYMAMEYATKGELFDLILQTEKLSEEIARYYFIQLLDSLEYLHLKGVHHCDIKLSNILLDGDYNLKLTDFGLSSRKLMNETMKGSGEYMAPEILLGERYNGPLVDIFAAGVVLFVMVFGKMPFYKAISTDVYYKALAGNRPDLFWKIHFKKMGSDFKPSESIIELLTMMLCYYPLNRPSLAEISSHGWFKKINTIINTQVISEFEHRIMKLKENDQKN
jgi:serine/threonine protein kinase